MAEKQGQFGTDLALTCDRCNRTPGEGGIFNPTTMAFVCFECLSDEELEAMNLKQGGKS